MLPTASRGLYAALEQVSAPHRGVRDNARLLLSCSQRLFVPLCAARCSYIYGVGVADNPLFFGGKSSSLMRCFAKTEICEQVLDSGSDPIQSLGPVSVAQSGCVRLLSQEPLNVRKIRTRMNRERTPVNAASTAAEQRSAKRLWRFAMSLSLKRGSAGASPPGCGIRVAVRSDYWVRRTQRISVSLRTYTCLPAKAGCAQVRSMMLVRDCSS